MTAWEALEQTSDGELVARVLAADRDAFAQVYDRYGNKLYDFAYSMLRQREDAADAVADSFVLFAERLGQLRDPDRLRPWLYAIVRSECLRKLRARTKLAYGDDERLAEMPDQTHGPEEAVEQEALRRLVWDAAAGLAERDRAMLDLHLRQGLEGGELAEAMGITAANAYVMLNRLRKQVDRSLGALLVARLGQADCPTLAEQMTGWDGGFSPLVRKRVARHVDGCTVCSARRARLVSPWSLLAAMPMFLAPPELRDRILDDVRLVAFTVVATPWWKRMLGPLTLLLITLLLGAAVLIWGPGTGEDRGGPGGTAPVTTTATGSAEPTPTTTTGATTQPTREPTPDATTSTTAPVTARLTGSPTMLDLGLRRTSAVVSLTNTGGLPLDWRVTSMPGWVSTSPGSGSLAAGATAPLTVAVSRAALPEGTSRGTVVVSSAAGTVRIQVSASVDRAPVVGTPSTPPSPSCSFPVSVRASDESGIASVRLHWEGPGGSGSAAMSGGGPTYTATAEPFNVGGTVRFWAVATDTRGNSSTGPVRSVAVNPCPQ